MQLSALTAAGRVLAVEFFTAAAHDDDITQALGQLAVNHPGAALVEAQGPEGRRLSLWAEDARRVHRGELDAHELLGRQPAAFRHRPPRAPGARKRGRR